MFKSLFSLFFVFLSFSAISKEFIVPEPRPDSSGMEWTEKNPGDFVHEGYELKFFTSVVSKGSSIMNTYVFYTGDEMATCYESIYPFNSNPPKVKCYIHKPDDY